jgi:hypothetical protein
MIYKFRILVMLDKPFNANILPLIDEEASRKEKTRADIIREIIYSYYHWTPAKRSQEQLEYDFNIEQQKNRDGYTADMIAGVPCLWVSVDREFLDLFMLDVINQYPNDDEEIEKQYWKTSRKILQQHFYHEAARACTTT